MAATLKRMEAEADEAARERTSVAQLAERLQARLHELEAGVNENAESIAVNRQKIDANTALVERSVKHLRAQASRLKQLEAISADLQEGQRAVEQLAHAAHKSAVAMVFERFQGRRDEWLALEAEEVTENGSKHPIPPDGGWLGRYQRFGQVEQLTLDLKFAEGEQIVGSGHDADGAFTVAGTYSEDTGRAALTLSYREERLEVEMHTAWHSSSRHMEGHFVSTMGISGELDLFPLDVLKESAKLAFEEFVRERNEWVTGDGALIDEPIPTGLWYGTISSNGQNESTSLRVDVDGERVTGTGHDADGAFTVEGNINHGTGRLWLQFVFQDSGLINHVKLQWEELANGRFALVGTFMSNYGVTGDVLIESAAVLEEAAAPMYNDFVADKTNWLMFQAPDAKTPTDLASGTWSGVYTGKDEDETISMHLTVAQDGTIKGSGHDADGALTLSGEYNRTGSVAWIDMDYSQTGLKTHAQLYVKDASSDGTQRLAGSFVSSIGVVGELLIIHRPKDANAYSDFHKTRNTWLKTQRISAITPVSGEWQGTYTQSDDVDERSVACTLAFDEAAGTLTGSGTDADGSFKVTGSFKKETGRMVMLLSYVSQQDSSHDELHAELHGTFFSSKRLEGEFVASTGVTGSLGLTAGQDIRNRRLLMA